MRVVATATRKPVRINRTIYSAIRPLSSLPSVRHRLFLPFVFCISPSFNRPTRRELHSQVYHCPDNNDLPTLKLLRVVFRARGWESPTRFRESTDEVSPTTWACWRRRDGQASKPPCIREYFTLTALRGIGWPHRLETLHRFSIMDLYITYSFWPMSGWQRFQLLCTTKLARSHFCIFLFPRAINRTPWDEDTGLGTHIVTIEHNFLTIK